MKAHRTVGSIELAKLFAIALGLVLPIAISVHFFALAPYALAASIVSLTFLHRQKPQQWQKPGELFLAFFILMLAIVAVPRWVSLLA